MAIQLPCHSPDIPPLGYVYTAVSLRQTTALMSPLYIIISSMYYNSRALFAPQNPDTAQAPFQTMS